MMNEAMVIAQDSLLGGATQQGSSRSVSAMQGFSLNDIARFEAAYRDGGATSTAASSVQQTGAGQGVLKVGATNGVDETRSDGLKVVMDALDNMNSYARRLGEDAQAISAKGEMSPGDMLMLTVRCHELLFHCELTSNIANRTSDGVQQLFKQQS